MCVHVFIHSWQYRCEDVYALVKAQNPGKTGYEIRSVGVNRNTNSKSDAFVDQVVIYRQATVTDTGQCPLHSDLCRQGGQSS